MNTKTEKWKINKFANKAKKNINALSSDLHQKVIRQLENLEKKPFGNVVKAEGKENIYRERIGSYRLYFRVDFRTKSIEIILFDHKSNIKKKIIQRLK